MEKIKNIKKNGLDEIGSLPDGLVPFGLGKVNPEKGDLLPEQAEKATEKIRKQNLGKLLEEEKGVKLKEKY